MARLLGIDFGEKRVGFAETDDLQIIAAPLETIENSKSIAFIKKYVSENQVDKLILGLPTYLNGDHSTTTEKVLAYAKKLEKHFPKHPLVLVDERYTSSMAFQSMIDAGVPKQKRKNKALIDKVSASIILRSYLDQNQSL
ncbi:MAG: Holliday junction resolvase RuvX [Flavobacteriales bacterium]